MRRVAKYNISNRYNRSRPRRFQSGYVFSMLASIVMTIVGLLCTVPFLWYMLFMKSQPTMSLFSIFAIFLLVFGSPLFFVGLISFFGKKYGGVSQAEMDIARIRFAAETQLMNDLLNNKK